MCKIFFNAFPACWRVNPYPCARLVKDVSRSRMVVRMYDFDRVRMARARVRPAIPPPTMQTCMIGVGRGSFLSKICY